MGGCRELEEGILKRLRKLPSPCGYRGAVRRRGRPLATGQKRHPLGADVDDEAREAFDDIRWRDENPRLARSKTERARMTYPQDGRVGRLVEFRLKQKRSYGRHTSALKGKVLL
jgi:hypothetical protein